MDNILALLEFYFFVVVFHYGVPVSVAQHTFKEKVVCQYVHSVVVEGAMRDNSNPVSKKKGLRTVITPLGCARRGMED